MGGAGTCGGDGSDVLYADSFVFKSMGVVGRVIGAGAAITAGCPVKFSGVAANWHEWMEYLLCIFEEES